MRPLDCRYRSERNTIQRTRHIDVREEYCDIRIGLQQGQCLLPLLASRISNPASERNSTPSSRTSSSSSTIRMVTGAVLVGLMEGDWTRREPAGLCSMVLFPYPRSRAPLAALL